MAESKTKNILLHVARQLFAKMGFENTTMNDIAVASQKGRRTLYTYFSSKEDLLDSVVESEFSVLVQSMSEVLKKDLPPQKKLLEMIYQRLYAVKEVVYRNGTLRAEFFRDSWNIEKVRRKFQNEEISLFRQVLVEGQEKGVFHLDDIDITAELIHYCMRGLEVPYIQGKIGTHLTQEIKDGYVARIIYGAVGYSLKEEQEEINSIINS